MGLRDFVTSIMSTKKGFRPFFVHWQHPQGTLRRFLGKYKYNGFTVYVRPHEDNDRFVTVTWALCSRKDRFCKRIGREVAMAMDSHLSINKRELPAFLGRLEEACRTDNPQCFTETQWLYVLKYVV